MLRKEIVICLQDMFHVTNSYVRSLNYDIDNASSLNFNTVIDADRRPSGGHERLYNSAIINGEDHNNSEIELLYREGSLHRINDTHRSYYTLHYSLFFP